MGTCEDEANLAGVELALAVHLVHRFVSVFIALVHFGYDCCPTEYTVRCRASQLLPSVALVSMAGRRKAVAWPARIR